MAQQDNEGKITATPNNGRNKKIALIVLVAILVVAIVATAVALLVRADFSPSLKEIDGYVLSISRGNVTIVKYTGTDKELEINDKLDGKRVVGIAEGAFKDNKTVTTLRIKSNASSFEIGAQAFYNMTSLAEVTLPDNVKSLPEQVFSGCGNLTSLTMGNGVEYIGSYAFSECGKLNKIYISESSGGNGKKSGIYDITMPTSLKTIDSYAFYKAITSSSSSIQLNNQLKTIGSNAFDGASRVTYVDFIGNTCALETIGSNAFYGCSYMRYNPKGNTTGTDVVLVGAQNMLAASLNSESLISIGGHAFENNTYASSKVTLKIKDNLESIGEYAFANNASIQNIEFCASKPSLGVGAFYNCASLVSVKYLTQNTDNGEFSVESKETSLHPDVKEIPSLLFYGCDVLNNFIIGSNIESIGSGAFAGCKKSSAITIYGAEEDGLGNIVGEKFSLYKLSDYSKINKGQYENYSHYFLTGNDLNNVNVYAYIGGFDKDSYTRRGEASTLGKFSFIDGNVKSIADYAFGNVSFDSIIIRDSVASLGSNVFNGCKSSDFTIYMLSQDESYYSTLTGGNMSSKMLDGIDEKAELSIMVPLRISQSTVDSLSSHLEGRAEITRWYSSPY